LRGEAEGGKKENEEMKKRQIRAGIIGSGFSAAFHFESMRKVYSTEVEVAGVYSKTKENREKFSRARGITPFDSPEGLLEKCDVVHVCTPPLFHEPLAVMALERDIYPIVEKPLTGYFGDGCESFRGDNFPKEEALNHALESTKRFLDAEKKSRARILYAENWVYAPPIQKEREIIEKTGAQILWIHGEEAHSGSHATTYGYWKYSGGGALIGKGCHPLTAALYLKAVEGRSRGIGPVKPRSVAAHTHALTRMDTFIDKGHIRSDYYDIEDFSAMHIEFEDSTIADIFAGGIHNWLEVAANNHRTICNINPNTTVQSYNPVDDYFRDIYVVEKIGTKQGWSNPAPDEDWVTGYPQEIEAFYRTVAYDDPVESDSLLAANAISTIYSAYVSAEKGGVKTTIKTF
jgi:predicted dehydrogenase